MASSTTDRAPHGMRKVAKAFLDALATYPEDRQREISKAALAHIKTHQADKRAKAKAKKAAGRAPRKARTPRSLTQSTQTANAFAA